MLTYAFDLLYAIYEEEGYPPSEIPGLILTHNLYGIEIDERAAQLAAFALVMKARERYRRFFKKAVLPNICVLKPIAFEEDELRQYLDGVGRDLFSSALLEVLHQFKEADNFGSLIRPVVTDVAALRGMLRDRKVEENIFLHKTHEKVLRVLEYVEFLSPRYQVVVANPPYMGGKGMNARLGAWLKSNYPETKSDLFAAFIERGFELVLKHGYSAMVTMQSWMFLSSYEKLRLKLLNSATIETMTHMANMVMGIAFGTAATVWRNSFHDNYKGFFSFVKYEDLDKRGVPKEFPVKNERLGWAAAADFKKIPGSPVAYWVSDQVRYIFNLGKVFEDHATPRQGLGTTNNNLFTRFWTEVDYFKITFKCKNKYEALASKCKWFPYSKGGGFRKWYGNDSDLVDWENDGQSIRKALVGKNPNIPRSETHYFKQGITWGLITSARFSARFSPTGGIFDVGGSKAFPSKKTLPFFLGLLNSKLTELFLKTLNPTLNFQVGDLKRIPVIEQDNLIERVDYFVNRLIELSSLDWNFYETSWDFTQFPLLTPENYQPNLAATYTTTRQHWATMTQEMQQLEEENNRIFIEAYGLQDELTPEVPLNEITLTCNPHYRYNEKECEVGSEKWETMEARLCADTLRELLSYAVGCMFGRYSLDKPGLILANQGQTLDDYRQQIPDPSFTPDADNVIPILDGEWFADDITERFKKFLRITFGDKNYQENLDFIENALGKDVRQYFLKDFYNDHVKRYKKRPIYWLFSSPKGSFNALIYLHRYRPDTISVILNGYLREFRTKLTAEQDHQERISISETATAAAKTKALKTIEDLHQKIQELDDYEREILYPLAAAKLEIDLDDGVKVNYSKFGKALQRIPGLTAG